MTKNHCNKKHLNSSGGPVVKKPPVNSGDTGLIPGLEDPRYHKAIKPPGTTTTEAHEPRARALPTEKPLQ